MQDLERVRYVAGNYDRLQGLRSVPFGLLILFLIWVLLPTLAALLGERDAATVEAVVLIAALFILGSLLAAFVLYFGTKAYYERRYGSVHHLAVFPSARRWVLGVAVFLVFASAVSGFPDGLPQVSVALLVFGIVLFTAWWPERRFRMHYLFMAILILIVAFSPSLALSSLSVDSVRGLDSFLAWNVLGFYCVVGGIFDHLLLVRTFKAVPEEGHGATG